MLIAGFRENAVVLMLNVEEEARHQLGQILPQDGYVVVALSTMAELRAIEDWRPIFALLVGGAVTESTLRETVSIVKEENSASAVLVLSPKVDSELVVSALRQGADDYFFTPLDIFALRRRLGQLLSRWRADMALRQSQDRLALAIHATEDAVWDSDLVTGVVWRNESYYNQFGPRPRDGQDPYQWWHERVHPDDVRRVSRSMLWFMTGEMGERWTEEYRYRRVDGSYAYVIDRGRLATDDDGRPIRALGAMLDITDRKRQEDIKLAFSQVLEMLASGVGLEAILLRLVTVSEEIFAGTVCSILLLDETRKHLRVAAAPSLPGEYNRTVDGMAIGPMMGSCGSAAYWGRRVIVEDIAASPLWEGVHQAAREANVQACWSQPIFSSGQEVLGTFAIYYRQPRAPDEVDVEFITEAARLAGIAIERRRDEDALRTAEALARKERDFAERLIETAQVIVMVLDAEGAIVRFNDYMEKLSGYSLQEVRGRDWLDVFFNDSDRPMIRDLAQRSLAGDGGQGVIQSLRTRASVEREVAWWLRRLRDEERGPSELLLIGHDVTDLKEIQERLLQAERLSAIGEAMAGLSHESRNAIARGQSALRMLDRRLTDRPDLSELIDGVRLAHDDLEVLYEEVRQYAAPLIFRSERCDMQVLWGEAWQQLISVHSERRIEVSSVVDTSDLWCRVDASSVKQVFRNILENSLEASGDPCRIDVEYADQVWDDRPALCVSVTDHGRGVGPEQLARMFDAFYTTKTHGTGLGMAICRRIIQKHGGDIRVSGSLGEGTTIEVILPRGSSG